MNVTDPSIATNSSTDLGVATNPNTERLLSVDSSQIPNAVAIWPVTGQGVENTKWPAVLYSQQISQNRKILANLNYHNYRYVDLEMSSDPEMLYRSRLVFGLRWAQRRPKLCFVTLRSFCSSTAGQGFQNTKWPAVKYRQCNAMLWTENSNEHPKTRTCEQQKHDIEIPQNWLVWSGSLHVIV